MSQVTLISFGEAFEPASWNSSEIVPQDYEQAGAPLKVSDDSAFRPKGPQSKEKDWIVSEMTATVHLIEKYQQAAQTLSLITRQPSDVGRFRVQSAGVHLKVTTSIVESRYRDNFAAPNKLPVRSTMLSTFFIHSWRFFRANKNGQASADIAAVLTDVPKNDETLFQRLRVRDNQTKAGYGLTNVATLREFGTPKAQKQVAAFIPALIGYIKFTREAYADVDDLTKITDPTRKEVATLGIRQAMLIVKLFASTLTEVSKPQLIVDSMHLSDELAAVTQKLSRYLLKVSSKELTDTELASEIERQISELSSTPQSSEYAFIDLSLLKDPNYTELPPENDVVYETLPPLKRDNQYGMLPQE